MKKGRNIHEYSGTAVYMAPEIVMDTRGVGHGKSVDFWALGVLLHILLTQKAPYWHADNKQLFEMIRSEKVNLKHCAHLSKHCKSLLYGLLVRSPAYRLGCGEGGIEELKQHPFFASVDWDAVYAKEAEPPFKPGVKGDDDYSCLDEEAMMPAVNDSDVLLLRDGASAVSKGKGKARNAFKDFAFVKRGDDATATTIYSSDDDGTLSLTSATTTTATSPPRSVDLNGAGALSSDDTIESSSSSAASSSSSGSASSRRRHHRQATPADDYSPMSLAVPDKEMAALATVVPEAPPPPRKAKFGLRPILRGKHSKSKKSEDMAVLSGNDVLSGGDDDDVIDGGYTSPTSAAPQLSKKASKFRLGRKKRIKTSSGDMVKEHQQATVPAPPAAAEAAAASVSVMVADELTYNATLDSSRNADTLSFDTLSSLFDDLCSDDEYQENHGDDEEGELFAPPHDDLDVDAGDERDVEPSRLPELTKKRPHKRTTSAPEDQEQSTVSQLCDQRRSRANSLTSTTSADAGDAPPSSSSVDSPTADSADDASCSADDDRSSNVSAAQIGGSEAAQRQQEKPRPIVRRHRRRRRRRRRVLRSTVAAKRKLLAQQDEEDGDEEDDDEEDDLEEEEEEDLLSDDEEDDDDEDDEDDDEEEIVTSMRNRQVLNRWREREQVELERTRSEKELLAKLSSTARQRRMEMQNEQGEQERAELAQKFLRRQARTAHLAEDEERRAHEHRLERERIENEVRDQRAREERERLERERREAEERVRREREERERREREERERVERERREAEERVRREIEERERERLERLRQQREAEQAATELAQKLRRRRQVVDGEVVEASPSSSSSSLSSSSSSSSLSSLASKRQAAAPKVQVPPRLKDLPLAELQKRPTTLDLRTLERHLSDVDFFDTFQLDRQQFYALPEWKRAQLKRNVKLF
jgi:Protein kinase domain/Villin headpiece domain